MGRCFLAAIVILLTATHIPAAVVLDQQHNTPTAIADSSNGAVSEMAQTFTVGVAGTLDHFELSMFQLGSIFTTNGDPQLGVYNTSGGLPTGSALTTVQIPSSQVPLGNAAFVTFNVSAAAIPVTVGEVLAVSIFTSSDPGPYFWTYDNDTATNYTGGAAFRRTRPAQPWQAFSPSADHEFKTYVNAVTYNPGDVNLDGIVNQTDLNIITGHWLASGQNRAAGDLTGDGLVNQTDLNLCTGNWLGTGGTGSLAAVPEPSGLALLALATGSILSSRRFRHIVRFCT